MPRKTSEDIRTILVESARVQVAALDAAIVFWDGWIQAAREFAQIANKELDRVEKEDVVADAVVGRMTDASRAFLRRITDLPDAAVVKFNAETERAPGTGRPKHTRSARAKE